MCGQAVFGHKLTMVVTLQNHSGIPTVLQVSHGEAAAHAVCVVQQGAFQASSQIVQAVQQGAVMHPFQLGFKVRLCL